jgi:hypothetical protein
MTRDLGVWTAPDCALVEWDGAGKDEVDLVFAFLIVMAVATLPSPLYGLYRTRDHFSALTITVVFAIFAGSTIAILQRDSSIAARIGRRGTMLGAGVSG